MKALALLFSFFISISTSLAQEHLTFTVHFESNASELKQLDLERLSTVCSTLSEVELHSIFISGYTDAQGDARTNEILGMKRANSLKKAFVAICDPALPISLVSEGEKSAFHSINSEKVLLREDRRAVLHITYFPANEQTELSKERNLDEQLDESNEIGSVRFEKAPTLDYIKPLIPSIDKPSQVFTVDPTREIVLNCYDGAMLRISGNSMIDPKGNLVSGPVEIHYRSFHESYEILASGIPMHIETASGTGHFETAGMYEVVAEKNGERLALKEGGAISVSRIKPEAVSSEFGTYELAPATGEWQQGGSLQNTVLASNSSQAFNKYNEEFGRLTFRSHEPDSLCFDERRAHEEYAHLKHAEPRKKVKYHKRKLIRVNPYAGMKGVPEIKLEASSKRVWRRNSRVTFQLDVPTGYFPEMRMFPKNMVYELTDRVTLEEFKTRFMREHWYQDMDLSIDPETATGTLRLKEAGEWISMGVSIAQNINDKNEQFFNRCVQNYSRQLARRKKRFDGKTEGAFNRWQSRIRNAELRAYNRATNLMSEEEKAWSIRSFIDSANAFRQNQVTQFMLAGMNSRKGLSAVRETFALQGFGVYNIDRIMKMPERQNVLVLAKVEDETPFEWHSAYGVLKNENSLITFWGSGNAQCGMLIARGKMESLFFVGQDGEIAVADVRPLNTMDRSAKRVELNCTRLEDPKSIEDLKLTASQ